MAVKSKHFPTSELRCKGCPAGDFCNGDTGFCNVDDQALELLEKLRERLATPLILNSASRCPAHNLRVGGKPGSKHLATPTQASTAFDISCDPRRYAFYRLDAPTIHQVKQHAVLVGFNGIGTYSNFVHVDLRDKDAKWTG